jgi:Fe2+ or Zn2+ uptake regulation protein
MNPPYSDHFAGHLRLAILRVLSELPGYKSNDSLLTSAVDALGVPATRDQVRTELAWLQEQRLVVTDEPGLIRLLIAVATERGLEVAAGRVQQPGVQRPSSRF